MEEKEIKQIKITLKQAITMIMIGLFVVFGVIFFIYHRLTTPSSYISSYPGINSTTVYYGNTRRRPSSKSNLEYKLLTSHSYGEIESSNSFVTSSEEFQSFLQNYRIPSYISESAKDLTQTDLLNETLIEGKPILTYFNDDFFKNNNLAICMFDSSFPRHNQTVNSITKNGSLATINISYEYSTYTGPLSPGINFQFFVLNKDISYVNFNIYTTAINNSYEPNLLMLVFSCFVISIIVIFIISFFIIRHNRKIENKPKSKIANKKILLGIIIAIVVVVILFSLAITYNALFTPTMAILKPIIYLYPTEETEVSVKLAYRDLITVSYPKYTTGWKVLAQKDGSLVDLSTNKNLYALYYEADNKVNFKVEQDGFIVKGEDIATFLEEKLAILGLTEREAEEFIIYWLPKLEANNYNYIRFATLDEINANMPLEINPTPDTIIRVLMTFKGLDKPIPIKEQHLISPKRNGFVAVEWGGTELK